MELEEFNEACWFSRKLVLIFILPIFIIIIIQDMTQIEWIWMLIFLICYYIAIILISVYYSHRKEKKYWQEKREMQEAEDKFYREYFRKHKK